MIDLSISAVIAKGIICMVLLQESRVVYTNMVTCKHLSFVLRRQHSLEAVTKRPRPTIIRLAAKYSFITVRQSFFYPIGRFPG